MKRITQKHKDCLEVFDYERKYRANKSGNQGYPPVMAKLLLSIANALRFVGFLLCFIVGLLLAALAIH